MLQTIVNVRLTVCDYNSNWRELVVAAAAVVAAVFFSLCCKCFLLDLSNLNVDQHDEHHDESYDFDPVNVPCSSR